MGLNFVGKSQRKWANPSPMWACQVDGWTLTITPSGELLPFEWLLTHRHRTQSGIASSVHEAEQQASVATIVIQRGTGRCFVCGSSASNRRIMYEPVRAVMLCDAHKAVCRRHQEDPCMECDQ